MSSTPRRQGFATAQVQAGYEPGLAQNTAVPPIYQSNAYEFASLADARDLFALRKSGNLYSRNANPTQLVFEERVTALEGGVAGAAVRPNTRALFAESLTNPLAQVLDIRAVADVAHEAGVPLVIDNTVATPALIRPVEHGADFVVHSATKYLGGHGTSMGGIVVDLGTFDFGADPDRWPQLTKPYARVRDLVLWDRFGPSGLAFVALVKSKYVHDLGPSISPFNAFQLLQGLETLQLRMARHSESALEVARFLAGHPAVARVHHPLLETSPWHDLALRYAPRGAASVFAFDLVAAEDADADWAKVERFVDSLEVVRLVANIGDARSLVSHPASMTHSHLSEDQLAEAGVTPTTIRLSVGLEDPADVIADLARSLDLVTDPARSLELADDVVAEAEQALSSTR
jgi:O-acetylhomoserine (thiol)-lyase